MKIENFHNSEFYLTFFSWANTEVFDLNRTFLFEHKNTQAKSYFYTVNVDFLRIEYMVLAKYQHMSTLELILIIKQNILILCKKSNPCYQVEFCTEIHIHQGNMSSLVGNVVSNKCCQKSALQCQLTCLYVLYTVNPTPLPPRSNTHCHESSENFLSKKKQVLGKLPILINYCNNLQK